MNGCSDCAAAACRRQVSLTTVSDEPARSPDSEPDQDEQIARLRRLLEDEIDRQIGPQRGCWPLLVAVAGVLLGIVLLLVGCP